MLRSPRADYAALVIPRNMKMPAGFKYQMPVVDARNPDAITFVVESDPPQLSLGCNIPRRLELQLMAVDIWQQAVWAQKQHHNRADHNAHIASALKKVQAVVRQMQKQQAAAAGADSAWEQVGRAGSAATWPAVVLPPPKKPGSGIRIDIQGPSREAQVTHVQHLKRREASLQPGTAPAVAALAQQQQPVKPLQAGTMAVAEAAKQTAAAGSRPAQQPTQAADGSRQQPSRTAAVVLPDAAIQAAVEAKVQAAMAQQMVQVDSNLQAMRRVLQESASRQMSDLRGELQQATQANQELRSQVARQEEATQRLQQTVEGQVSNKT